MTSTLLRFSTALLNLVFCGRQDLRSRIITSLEGFSTICPLKLQNRSLLTSSGCLSIAACLAFLMTASTVQAQIIPVEIEGLPGSFTGSVFVKDINERGQVVGFAATAAWGHAIFWTPEGGTIDLGGGPCDQLTVAWHVTDDGIVIGSNNCDGGHAFYWTEALGMLDIAPLLYDESSEILDVDSKSGQAVGQGCSSVTNSCGTFLWTLEGGVVEMSSDSGCRPNDLNRVGQAALSCSAGAFIWSETEGLRFLEPISPDDTCFGEVLNDHGQVVGSCLHRIPGTFITEQFGFSWTAAGGMIRIDVTTSTGLVDAFIVNNNGQVGGHEQVVGVSFNAWAWSQAGGTVLIDPGNGGGVNLRGLTDDGLYFGDLTESGGAVQNAFVWTQQDGFTRLRWENGGNSNVQGWN